MIFSKLNKFYWQYSQGHFRLRTLYCHNVLNISQIIKSQTELQILGIYSPDIPRNILKTLRKFQNAQIICPIVLGLERESFTPHSNHISIFPSFYSVDRRATIHQVLTRSFCKDQGYYMVAKAHNITELSIYLVDTSDMPSISVLAKNMAVSFPQIGFLNLCFERRCQIVSFLL